jgi:hypothetical protein
MIAEFLGCRIEEVLLTVACSAPLFKSPVSHGLRRMGFTSVQEKTRELNSFHSSNFLSAFERHDIQTGQGIISQGGRPQRVDYDEEKGGSGYHGLNLNSSISTLRVLKNVESAKREGQ